MARPALDHSLLRPTQQDSRLFIFFRAFSIPPCVCTIALRAAPVRTLIKHKSMDKELNSIRIVSVSLGARPRFKRSNAKRVSGRASRSQRSEEHHLGANEASLIFLKRLCLTPFTEGTADNVFRNLRDDFPCHFADDVRRHSSNNSVDYKVDKVLGRLSGRSRRCPCSLSL